MREPLELELRRLTGEPLETEELLRMLTVSLDWPNLEVDPPRGYEPGGFSIEVSIRGADFRKRGNLRGDLGEGGACGCRLRCSVARMETASSSSCGSSNGAISLGRRRLVG